jgi:hypothetical protein
MSGQFKVLHTNIGKRKTVQWSLFCDESSADFDALAVVEPYFYEGLDTGEPAFPVERNWQLFKPSVKQEMERSRATVRRCHISTCLRKRLPNSILLTPNLSPLPFRAWFMHLIRRA